MDHQTHAGTSFSAAGRRTVRNPASQRGKSTRRKPKRPSSVMHIEYTLCTTPARAPSMPGSRDARHDKSVCDSKSFVDIPRRALIGARTDRAWSAVVVFVPAMSSVEQPSCQAACGVKGCCKDGFVTQSHSWISRAELSLAPEPIERGLRLCFCPGHELGRATKLPSGVRRQTPVDDLRTVQAGVFAHGVRRLRARADANNLYYHDGEFVLGGGGSSAGGSALCSPRFWNWLCIHDRLGRPQEKVPDNPAAVMPRVPPPVRPPTLPAAPRLDVAR